MANAKSLKAEAVEVVGWKIFPDGTIHDRKGRVRDGLPGSIARSQEARELAEKGELELPEVEPRRAMMMARASIEARHPRAPRGPGLPGPTGPGLVNGPQNPGKSNPKKVGK